MNVVFAHLILAELARLDGDLDAAERGQAAAEAALAGRPLVPPQLQALCAASSAMLALARGDLAAARSRVTGAIDSALVAGDMPVVARIGIAAACLHDAAGDPLRAARALGATEALRGAPDRSRVDGEQLADRLRRTLGAETYAAAHADGRAADRATALALLDPRS